MLDPESPIGGSEAYTSNLLNFFVKNGFDVKLIGVSDSLKATASSEYTFISLVNKSKINSFNFQIYLFISNLFFRLPNESIIHVQRPDFLLPFILFQPLNPKICTLHGRILESVRLKKSPLIAYIYQAIESWCLRRADQIIAVDESTKNFYEKQYPEIKDNITIIQSGIDLNKFKPINREKIRQEYNFHPTDKIILFVGRLEAEKNLNFLLESYKMVSAKVPDAKLVFVGEGREHKNLINLAKDLSIKNVHFLGAQHPKIVPEIINCGDMLVLCSLYEGSPTVVKEAIACGVPVVSTDVGDVRNIIKNNAIGRIAENDKEKFAESILDVLNIDRDRCKKECKNISIEFGYDKIAENIIEVYQIARNKHITLRR